MDGELRVLVADLLRSPRPGRFPIGGGAAINGAVLAMVRLGEDPGTSDDHVSGYHGDATSPCTYAYSTRDYISADPAAYAPPTGGTGQVWRPVANARYLFAPRNSLAVGVFLPWELTHLPHGRLVFLFVQERLHTIECVSCSGG